MVASILHVCFIKHAAQSKLLHVPASQSSLRVSPDAVDSRLTVLYISRLATAIPSERLYTFPFSVLLKLHYVPAPTSRGTLTRNNLFRESRQEVCYSVPATNRKVLVPTMRRDARKSGGDPPHTCWYHASVGSMRGTDSCVGKKEADVVLGSLSLTEATTGTYAVS